MEVEYNHLNHATCECKYHVVFTLKYRKKLLFGRSSGIWARYFTISRAVRNVGSRRGI